MIISGQFISATGYATPWMIAGAAVTALGSGLIYTFDVDSSAGKWIGFQIIGGVGIGLSFQVPIMLTQATTCEADVPLATAIILCKFL